MRRRGFTMAEILVALVIVAVISAVAYPAVMNRIRASQVSALSQTFLGLSQGIAEYKKALTKYPEQILLLTRSPLSTELDACGNAIGSTTAGLWRGPYVSREILSTGIAIGDVTIRNDLRRTAPVPPNPAYMLIDAPAVEIAAVNELEKQLDGDNNSDLLGTIRWTSDAIAAQIAPANPTTAIPAAPTGTYNLTYSIPISGC